MIFVPGKLCVIHIPKTGGISTHNWIGENFEDARAVRTPTPHLPLNDLAKYTKLEPSSFEVIVAVLRDPYDQQLSQWVHWRDGYARGGRSMVERTAAMYPELTHWLLDPYCDVQMAHEERNNRLDPEAAFSVVRSMGYYEYFCTVDGRTPPNLLVVPFHDFPARIREIAGRFKSDLTPYPHVNKSTYRDVPSYYTPLATDIVSAKFEWSISRGYVEGRTWDAWVKQRLSA